MHIHIKRDIIPGDVKTLFLYPSRSHRLHLSTKLVQNPWFCGSMYILILVPAQLGQITSVIKLFKRSTWTISHCCVVHSCFPYDSLRIEVLREGISSFLLLFCFPVASLLFVVFNLASGFFFFRHLQTLFSLHFVCSRKTKPGSWGRHVMRLNESCRQKSTATNEFASSTVLLQLVADWKDMTTFGSNNIVLERQELSNDTRIVMVQTVP